MKRSNSLCFLVSMAVSRTARRESTAANDLTRESRRSVNRSRTCAYMFALRSARGTKLAKRSDAQEFANRSEARGHAHRAGSYLSRGHHLYPFGGGARLDRN